MSSGFYGEYLSTLGMEYESIAMEVNDVQQILSNTLAKKCPSLYKNLAVTNDASVQFKARHYRFSRKFYKISLHTNAAHQLPVNYDSDARLQGFELLTTPLIIPEFSKTVYAAFQILQGAGDFTSERASVHYHVGYANNLLLMKNILTIALNTEPVFYRLGGMGGLHRSYSNQATYCRPLLNSAVVPVSNSKKTMDELMGKVSRNVTYVRVANPMAALGAKTIEQFWASFGISYSSNISNKYHPVRYSGWNFFSMAMHKTMEVRHCNQSLDAALVIAVGKFVRATVELATVLNKREIAQFEPMDSNVEIGMGPAVNIIQKIMGFCYDKEIENLPTPRELRIIFETLESSSFKSIPETPVLTHKDGFVLPRELAELGKLEEVTEFLQPKFVDIHTIDNHEQSIYDSEGDQN